MAKGKDQSSSNGPPSASQAGSSGAGKTNQPQANANSPENDFGAPNHEWDLTTHQVQASGRQGSDFWTNPRAPRYALSPIPEEHEPTSPAKDTGPDTPVRRLEQSLQNISKMLKNHGQASDDPGDDSSSSSPSSSSSYETDDSLANAYDGIKRPPRKRVSNASTLKLNSSPEQSDISDVEFSPAKAQQSGSPSSSSSSTDDSLNLQYDPTSGRQRPRVSNASTMVLSPGSPAGSFGVSPTAPSPGSPNSPKSILRPPGKRGRKRQGRLRSIRHYTRGVERLQFNRYIYDLFRGTLTAKPKSRRSPKSKASSTTGSSSAPSSATSGQSQPQQQQAVSGAQAVASSAEPAATSSQPQQQSQTKSNQPTGGQAKAKAPPKERGEISKISRNSMKVLNTIVKDLIIRFAHETNHLLADSRFVQLRETEALAAIKLMLNHRQDLYNQVFQQYRQLAPSIKSSSGSSSGSGGTAGGTPPTPKTNRRGGASGRRGKDAVSTANQPSSAPSSRYGPGSSPVAGSSGSSGQ